MIKLLQVTGKCEARDSKRIFLPELDFDSLILCGQTMILDPLLTLTRAMRSIRTLQLEDARMQESGKDPGLRAKGLCLWLQAFNRNCRGDEAGHVNNMTYGDRHSDCDHYNRA